MTQKPIDSIFIYVLSFDIQNRINHGFNHHYFANLYGHFIKYFINNHLNQYMLFLIIIKWLND